jgi:hypothetical protein
MIYYFEPSEIRNVVEWHFLDIHFEGSELGDLAEGSVRISLNVFDLELSLIAHLLELVLLIERNGMRVLIMLVFGHLVGVETKLLPEGGESKCLIVHE